MKHRAITTAFLMVLACFQSAWAYSAIWNVDGWDTTRLKEAGISVTTWKHDQIGEDPAMNWVKITYDPSKLREAPNVLMTLHVIGDDGQTVSAFRAERKKGEADKLVILCAVRKENMENSYLQILVPKLLSEGDKRAFGDPGFGGYSLRLSRIMELAGKVAVEQAAESEKE